MTDELIILLSTDWFLAYWQRIGIDLAGAKKICIQQGCRTIVSLMVGNANRMYQVDFTEERKRKTDAEFSSLLIECNSDEELTATRKEWENRTDKDNNAGWSWYHLNQIICSPRVEERFPVLSEDVRSCVSDVWKQYDFRESDTRASCSSSFSEWDVRIHSVLGGPDTLHALLNHVLRDHKLQAFWDRLQERLTAVQLLKLIDWYREATIAMTRGEQPDLIPSFVK
jgi:hypothetical protein